MEKPPSSPKASSKWFWILILLALFIVVVVWFANPLGKVEQPPPAQTVKQSTEWAPEPEGPAVEVNLPETPLKNTVVDRTESPGN